MVQLEGKGRRFEDKESYIKMINVRCLLLFCFLHEQNFIIETAELMLDLIGSP